MNSVRIINKSNNPLPSYATPLSAGMDLRANVYCLLYPGQRTLIKTGLFIELPEGYEAQIRSRSGLAFKHGVTVLNSPGIMVLNSPGTIDADYRGEIGIILYNSSTEPFEINIGDRIAQMVIPRYERVNWEEVAELSSTERGEGGFGSTNIK